MNIVLDTNVFVSGIFFTGPPYWILEAWRDRTLQLILSQEILDEYHRVGSELAARYPSIDIRPILNFLAREGRVVDAPPLPDQVCADAADDKFIACALAAACDIVVSGDKHLLTVSGFRGISVLTPREFVGRYLGGANL